MDMGMDQNQNEIRRLTICIIQVVLSNNVCRQHYYRHGTCCLLVFYSVQSPQSMCSFFICSWSFVLSIYLLCESIAHFGQTTFLTAGFSFFFFFFLLQIWGLSTALSYSRHFPVFSCHELSQDRLSDSSPHFRHLISTSLLINVF